MRIVELPLPLCPPGQLALSVLTHRENVMQVGQQIWLGDNYDFDGSTPPESYQVLAAHGPFARFGFSIAEYPAETHMLDFDVGLIVQLIGADTTIATQTGTNGLSNELLVFIDNEIMSVIGVELVAAATYRLKLARGRYSTPIEAHVAASAVYIVALDDLLILTHPTFNPGETVTLKVALSQGRFTQDLSEIEAIEHEVTGKAFEVSPSNLIVNGDSRNPKYVASTDVKIQWSLPDLRESIVARHGLKVRSLLEIISDVDESVLWSKLTFAAAMKITGAKMDLIRAGEPTFTVRITTDVLGTEYRINSTPITLQVTT
jgi:hypothetical protein